MSYNGSGTFNINTTGQPVVAGTVISSSAFNSLTSDLATGLTTAITKDGQTTTTARITFAQGITSSLVTDSSSVSTGSIITAGGAGIAKNLYVGGSASFSAQPIFSSLTASSAVATDASKGLVSVTNTGTGNNVLATSPTLVTPILGTPQSGTLTNCTGLPTTALTGAITEANGGTGTTTGYYGFKNRIINGNFGINQRGVSGTVTLASGGYGHDRFKGGASGCTYTFATSANITTLTITAGSLIQVIEGLNLESATYTLSFSGTAQGKIGAGSFSSSGVTGSVTGGSNLNIEFNTGTLSLVQLEKGSTATSFDYRPIGTELSLCQRYFQLSRSAFGGGNTSVQALLNIAYRVTMRATPDLGVQGAISITDGTNDFVQSAGGITNVASDSNAGMALLTNFTGLTVSRGYTMRLANSNAITLSAEL